MEKLIVISCCGVVYNQPLDFEKLFAINQRVEESSFRGSIIRSFKDCKCLKSISCIFIEYVFRVIYLSVGRYSLELSFSK